MATEIKSIEDFLAKTNFANLKEQKKALIKAISDADEKFMPDLSDHLEGLLSFIDSFQDMAVDVYGKDENEVFDLSEDDEVDELEKELDEEELQKTMDKCRDENY